MVLISGVRAKFIWSHHIMSSRLNNGIVHMQMRSLFYNNLYAMILVFLLRIPACNAFRIVSSEWGDFLCISNSAGSNRGLGDSKFQCKRLVTVEGGSV